MSDLSTIVLSSKESFEKIASSDMNFQREAGFALQQLQNNNYSMTVAMSDKQSLINALTNVAAIGLSLNPANKLAYLIPRNKKICLDVSYMGLVKLATDTGSITMVKAQIVREKDIFELNGVDREPKHSFNPFSKDRGDIVGAYVVAKTFNGDYLTETMSLDELLDIRDRSEGYKAYKNGKASTCTWITDESEMMKKTVIKKAYKLWPKTEKLDNAIKVINEHEGIDFEKEKSLIDVTPASIESLEIIEKLLEGVKDGEKRLLKHINDKDKTSHEILDELYQLQADYAIKFLESSKGKK